jgi:hypothetical protein
MRKISHHVYFLCKLLFFMRVSNVFFSNNNVIVLIGVILGLTKRIIILHDDNQLFSLLSHEKEMKIVLSANDI